MAEYEYEANKRDLDSDRLYSYHSNVKNLNTETPSYVLQRTENS